MSFFSTSLNRMLVCLVALSALMFASACAADDPLRVDAGDPATEPAADDDRTTTTTTAAGSAEPDPAGAVGSVTELDQDL